MRAILAAIGAWLVPAYAYACEYGDPCGGAPPRPEDFTLLGTTVPGDGVLSLRIGEAHDIEGWQPVVTVVDALGIAVPGRFVRYPDFDALAWRPDAPFREDESYRVTLAIDVDEDEAEYASTCGDHATTVDVVITPATGSSRPSYVIEDEYVVEPIEDLRALVCCDDARPHIEEHDAAGYGCPGPATLEYGNGFCTPAHGVGMRRITYALSSTGDGDRYAVRLVSQQGVIVGPSDESVSKMIDEPACLRFEVLDLATGEISATEQCHDTIVGEPFGLVELDAMTLLEANCEGAPYVCQTDSKSWDRMLCSPYEPPSIGGCSFGPTPDDVLGWIALWWVIGARARRACGRRRSRR